MSAAIIGAPAPMHRFHGQRSQEWRTPEHVFDALNAEFDFTLDPCWDGAPGFLLNGRGWRDFDTPDNGLEMSWAGHRVFCNPPYRRGQIERWLAKAREATLAVYLLPSRTGATWWNDALAADEIRFIRGRLKFSGAVINAPEWSCIVVFRPAPQQEKPA